MKIIYFTGLFILPDFWHSIDKKRRSLRMFSLLIFSYFLGWISFSIGMLHPDKLAPHSIKAAIFSFHKRKLLLSLLFPLSLGTLHMIYHFPSPISFLILFYFTILFRLAITDFFYLLVPILPIFVWIIGGGIFQMFFLSFDWLDATLRFVCVYMIGLILYFLLCQSFGMGDVYFLSGVAFLSSYTLVLSVLKFSILLAGVYVLSCLVIKRMKRKDMLPFIPFLSFSFYFHIFWQPWMIFSN